MPIYVSRTGLTRCPECGTHTRVAADVERTRCSFCDAELVVALERTSLRPRIGARGALIAASLAGLTLTAPIGCEKGETSNDGPKATQPAAEPSVEPEYGAVPPPVDRVDEPPSMAEYGAPPPMMRDPAPTADGESPDDPAPQPAYGVVPAPEPDASTEEPERVPETDAQSGSDESDEENGDTSEDADEDATEPSGEIGTSPAPETRPAPEPQPQPKYGVVPVEPEIDL